MSLRTDYGEIGLPYVFLGFLRSRLRKTGRTDLALIASNGDFQLKPDEYARETEPQTLLVALSPRVSPTSPATTGAIFLRELSIACPPSTPQSSRETVQFHTLDLFVKVQPTLCELLRRYTLSPGGSSVYPL